MVRSITTCLMFLTSALLAQASLTINERGYFETRGLNVMVFHDFYPEGHQGGVAIIHHGVRTATNGDLRLSPTPGQWQPLPKPGKRVVDRTLNFISIDMTFPDSSRHRTGFNPMINPDVEIDYTIRVEGAVGASFRILVDLEKPLPQEWQGKVGLNLELFPTILFGKTWQLDGKSGHFPRQANGPMAADESGELQMMPLATGRHLTIAPESEAQCMGIESLNGDLHLIDGRGDHNNGWFVVRTLVPLGATSGAIEWLVTPRIIPDWIATPVIHVSQVGYRPGQNKRAVIELDRNDTERPQAVLQRIDAQGVRRDVLRQAPDAWGPFLRYEYVIFDFSAIHEPGIYQVQYGNSVSNPFIIGDDVYARGIWQPTLEYFLPVQMCHMRVNDKYRVWHGLCHMDDALMAPVNINHFDGYVQGPSTLSPFKPLQHVPGLNAGGWHDAGDYDLRVESQAGTVYILSLAYEAFQVDYDQTLIDQENHLVEIHHPDGVPDILQQVEHGALTLLGGYRSLGRLYRGIICPSLRQYVLLGDAAAMTDGVVYPARVPEQEADELWFAKVANRYSRLYDPLMTRGEIEVVADSLDDRLVFTEENPGRALGTIPALAAAARVLKGYRPALAAECLRTAEALWEQYHKAEGRGLEDAKVHALAELMLSTGRPAYKKSLVNLSPVIRKNIAETGWVLGRVMPLLAHEKFARQVASALREHKLAVDQEAGETPFGVPYRPHIWGAGWGIQEFGFRQYFLHRGWPDIFSREYMLNALNFVLGCHPGQNTASFASGVGSHSLLVAYGVNRADWSYIPGGVGSGTALIRPDFAELKEWPYLWQQSEYVIGGGAEHFMFLALAAARMAL